MGSSAVSQRHHCGLQRRLDNRNNHTRAYGYTIRPAGVPREGGSPARALHRCCSRRKLLEDNVTFELPLPWQIGLPVYHAQAG
jgi:hypothetical protein